MTPYFTHNRSTPMGRVAAFFKDGGGPRAEIRLDTQKPDDADVADFASILPADWRVSVASDTRGYGWGVPTWVLYARPA
jgi:hypothetical protein